MPYPLFHLSRLGDLPMVLSAADFAEAFPGEGEHLELKRGVSASRTQEAAVAFSNTEGGVLIAGVAPDGQIVGVTQPGEKAKDLHQALRDARDPGRYEVRQLVVEDKTLLVLSIARRREGFAQTSAGAVLVRRGASNVPLLGADLSRFIARHAFEAFETTPTSADLEKADQDLLKRLREVYGWAALGPIADQLEEAGFATREAGRRVLTVAGALLLLAEPAAIGGRPYIDVRRYSGDEVDPDRLWEVRGPVDRQVNVATATIVEELGAISAIIGARRVDIPRLPPRAIREAVANAVAHRSYEHAGTAIRVEIRSTSVTITSPGALREPVTVANIRFTQAARNDALLGALRRMGLAEDLGQGINRIEDDMAAELLQPPIYEDDGSFFTVRLPLGGAVTPRERAWVRDLIQRGRLNARAAIVIVTVARQGSIDNGDVRALLDVDSVRARAMLQSLIKAGVLVQQGERGGAHYVVAPGLGVPARIRHTDAELDAMVLARAQQGPVTNSIIRNRSGLDRIEARVVLRRLVDRGELVQLGEKRGTRYVLPPPRGNRNRALTTRHDTSTEGGQGP
ncbi:MAG: ATP-binding protein [Acidimicrobiales bacterium]